MYKKIKNISEGIRKLFIELNSFIQIGRTTEEIDDFCFEFYKKINLKPAALNYKGFPKSVCISINNVVCHGIPNKQEIKANDIIKIDAAATDGEFFSDACEVYLMSEAEEKKKHITKVNYEGLWAAISIVQPGVRTGDIGYVLNKYAQTNGYSVIRDFCGHGVGEKLHLPPSVPFLGTPYTGYAFKTGDIFTIEPMYFDGKNIGNNDVNILEDGWTAVIKNGNISSQVERTILVTEDGYEVLTYTYIDEINNRQQKAKGISLKKVNFPKIK